MKSPPNISSRLSRVLRNRRGNVAIIVCLVLVPLIFAVGMGVDYTLATRRQDQLNGIADAAALAAVTPDMMGKTSTDAQAAAQAVFMSQAVAVTNVNFTPSSITITATDAVNGTNVNRTVVVNYTATSNNAFSAVLGIATIGIGGSASATSSVAPKIDFYMLLDTSPSMEIPATVGDINTMVAKTGNGCAFACHETNFAAEGYQNPANITCADGTSGHFPLGDEDNYMLARCLGVTLRIDNVNAATTQLMNTAPTIAAQNHTAYRAAIYTMDFGVTTLSAITSDYGTLQSKASNLTALPVYDNNCLSVSNCNNDQDSDLDQALVTLNGIMPNPGGGSSNPGDPPEEVLFIVSDGVNDEQYNGSRVMAPINAILSNPDTCTTIKNRGIRIAFLYLTYYPLPTNGFYMSNIAPFHDQIATDAQNCASDGLYFEVNTGGDVTGAMTALFKKAVATAHLTH